MTITKEQVQAAAKASHEAFQACRAHYQRVYGADTNPYAVHWQDYTDDDLVAALAAKREALANAHEIRDQYRRQRIY